MLRLFCLQTVHLYERLWTLPLLEGAFSVFALRSDELLNAVYENAEEGQKRLMSCTGVRKTTTALKPLGHFKDAYSSISGSDAWALKLTEGRLTCVLHMLLFRLAHVPRKPRVFNSTNINAKGISQHEVESTFLAGNFTPMFTSEDALPSAAVNLKFERPKPQTTPLSQVQHRVPNLNIHTMKPE